MWKKAPSIRQICVEFTLNGKFASFQNSFGMKLEHQGGVLTYFYFKVTQAYEKLTQVLTLAERRHISLCIHLVDAATKATQNDTMRRLSCR
jgi:hypothetical protein